MLQSITIRNIAVIDKLHIDFEKGFSVLTGETGAGKSILLDALGFALGNRTQPSKIIREGQEEASVTVVFDSIPISLQKILIDQGLGNECQLIIRRSLTIEGKSKVFLNDHPTSATFLNQIAPHLIEIHGQFDHLLNTSQQLESLDRYLNISREPLEKAYYNWKNSEKALQKALESISTKQDRLEELSFLIKELETLDPKDHEEENLLLLKETRKNTNKIETIVNMAQALYEEPFSLEKRFLSLQRNLENIEMPHLSALKQSIETALLALKDIQSEVQDLSFSLEDASFSLDQIEERLYNLRHLGRKHQVSTEDLPKTLNSLRTECDKLTESTSSLSHLQQTADAAKKVYQKTATEFHTLRQKGAEDLSEAIKEILKPLKLPHAIFLVSFQDLQESSWSIKGMHKIEFYISTNPGISPGPLNKVASGGELSRVMLALKTALKEKNNIPTVVFDEVDIGLGGGVAAAMGEQLSFLSKESQILAITHSPQLAAYADHHFCVSKSVIEGKTISTIQILTHQEKIEELSRMLAGKTMTDLTRAAAQELLRDKVC